ncbi:MAG: DUF1800 domain-containing protein [Planctomycetes bacterium]|nr:DUF1800 domain-containing protein [Planctomycetota bacterium]
MSLSRRNLLQLGAAGATVAATSGCDRFWGLVARSLGAGLPARIDLGPDAAPDLPAGAADPIRALLDRAAFGPRPGDVERVRAQGAAAWVEEQLAPETIDDTACTVLWRRFESLHLPPGDLYEFKKQVAVEELARATVLRAVYSRRQLYEVMVEFWSDHFNIDVNKAECAWLKTADDRDVIRRHALGNFRDLLRASALSPAMLVYLDGRVNQQTRPGEAPNENYARELLELHTLGVHGGYTQRDVMEAARCLTGWSVRTGWRKGSVAFDRDHHDPGEKTVLGLTIPAGGGEQDLDRLIDIVADHPSTARFVAAKLCRRLVAEDPPPALVERAAEIFRRERGAIPPVVRAILLAPDYAAACRPKLKRPFRFVVSALRALGAETDAGRPVLDYLGRMGQSPFQYPTPDGYPDEAYPWLGTVLWRWNFALALVHGGIQGTRFDAAALATALARGSNGEPATALSRLLLGRAPAPTEAAALAEIRRGRSADAACADAAAVLLASPAFSLA